MPSRGNGRGGSDLLHAMRVLLKKRRIEKGRLFDTIHFTRMFVKRMKSAVEIKRSVKKKRMHVLPSKRSPSLPKHVHGRSSSSQRIHLVHEMPKDPFTKRLYQNEVGVVEDKVEEVMEEINVMRKTPSVDDAGATTPQRYVPLLLLLHVQNTDGNAPLAAPLAAPPGWRAEKDEKNLQNFVDESITALYFVFESFKIKNFMKRLKESWRVLVHGGALFFSFPEKNDVKDEDMRSLLLKSKFCSVERLETLGLFDVHTSRNEKNVYQRWGCRACEKTTPKINVAIQ